MHHMGFPANIQLNIKVGYLCR